MKKKRYIFIITTLVILALDQITKYSIQSIEVGKSIVLIPGFLEISHFINYGASFGMLQDKTWFLITFSVIVIGLIAYYYRRIPAKYDIFVAMILGGTLGNLFDRSIRGYVVDFINFNHWPAFNVADIAVTLGAVILIIMLMKDKQDRTIMIRPKRQNKRKSFKRKGMIF